MRLLDRILSPLNRLGTKHFVKGARAKVWANTTLLAATRSAGGSASTAGSSAFRTQTLDEVALRKSLALSA